MKIHNLLNNVLFIIAIALATNLGLAAIEDYQTHKGLAKSLVPFSVSTAEAQPNLPGVDPDEDTEFVDQYCSERLFGTLSAKTCWEGCKQLGYACVKAITHPATEFTGLEEDVDCYTCKKLTCGDFGRLDVAGRNACDARMDKRSVAAPPLPDGTPCWKCRDAEKCNKKFKKASWLPQCQWNCRKKDHHCVKVGVHDTKDCYECKKKPKPPKTCKDAKLLTFGQCNTCPADQKCVPAGVVAQNGQNCFKCTPKKKKPPKPPDPPKVCEDVKGYQSQPCQCGPRDHIHNFTSYFGKDCCLCIKDECGPDGYNVWDCVRDGKCTKMGGVCEPRTKVRGGPQCYNCRIPQKEKKTCQDHGVPEKCNPNPCEINEVCEERGVVLSGKEMSCAFCEPKDDGPWQPDPDCSAKELSTSCAQCYSAQMACEQIKISDDPEKWCAKCKQPVDQRCPDGEIEGACASEVCVGGERCVDASPNCHICIPPEQCLPGRYKEADCKKECKEGTKCQRIEGCEQYGDDPRDVQIEETPPDVKYCGPDGTQALLESITRIRNRVNRLSDNEKGIVDGTMFLDKNGMSIDLRMRPITKQDAESTMVCPSKPCTDGTMKSVGLCGHCVMSHILNDILYGFVSNQLSVPWHIQLAGAHYAEYTSYGGLDPLASQAAYMMGNDASESMGNGTLSIGDLCSLLNKTSIKTSFLGSTNGFEIMGKERGFLKDCKPCAFPAQGTLKDFSEGDWTLEDKSKDHYPKPPEPAIEPPPDCCYACLPYEKPKCEDSRVGSCDFDDTCSEAETCVPVGYECHLCEPKSCEDLGFQDKCPTGEECAPVMTESGKSCCDCYKIEKEDPPPKACPNNAHSDGSCGGACGSDQECVSYDSFFDISYEISFDDSCFVCADKDVIIEEEKEEEEEEEGEDDFDGSGGDQIFVDGFESGDTASWSAVEPQRAEGQVDDITIVEPTGLSSGTAGNDTTDQCPRGTFDTYNCGGTCDSNQECVLDGADGIFDPDVDATFDSVGKSDIYRTRRMNCYKCVEKSEVACPFLQYKESNCKNECESNEECITAAASKSRFYGSLGGGLGLNGISMATPNSREDCYVCAMKPHTTMPPGCPYGYSPGECDGTCDVPREVCSGLQGDNGPCHICREKRCDSPLIDGDQCEQCVARGGTCNPITTVASSTGFAPLCYQCEPKSPCPPGLVCDCGMCYEMGQACLPVTRGYDGEPCYKCIPRDSIVVIEYYIVIIETPRGRLILDRSNPIEPMLVGGFTPKSVMALARADSVLGNFGKQLGSIQSIAKAFGGAQKVSLQNIASLINQNMGGKRKFGENCFDKSFDQAPAKQSPPSDAGAASSKASKKHTPSTSGIGEDGSKDYIVDGPIIACGQTEDGEDAIKIFDASGRTVQTVLSSELNENPNALISGLMKAESLSQNVLNFKQGGVKGVMQKMKNMMQSKTKQTISNALKGKGDEKNTVPNDPLYEIKKKKKKKFLGIFGSSNDKAKMKTGSSVSLGGVLSIGAGAGGGSIGTGGSTKSNNFDVPDQWGIKAIGYTPLSDPNSAWHIINGNKKNVVVAVIDSGLDHTHIDAPEFIWRNEDEIPNNGKDDDGNGYIDDVNGWNFLNDNNDLTDYKGHGTHVAGIIAAKTNNKKGISGINPGAVIMPLKVANANGELNNINLYRAIHYAVDNGARVINISLGGNAISQLEQSAMNYAYLNGVFVAVASGNTNAYLPDIGPAAAKRAFAVGAMDFNGARSQISSKGPGNALLGPGEGILSLRGVDSYDPKRYREGREKYYYRESGTSFSTPMVSATASLMLALNSKLTPDDIADILMGTATDMAEPGWDHMTGAGLLNARKALESVKDKFLTVKIENFRQVYNDRKKFVGVDVFATVRGKLKEFSISISKGKRGKKYKPVGGVVKAQANNEWVLRISKDDLKGSKEWLVKIEAIDKKGNTKSATALLTITK